MTHNQLKGESADVCHADLHTSKVTVKSSHCFHSVPVSYTHLDVYKRQELYQEDEDGNHLVISFASQILNSCERNYNVTEKELLSIVFACDKFRTYILGYSITVRSDHKSISFLKQCKLSHGLSLIHI